MSNNISKYTNRKEPYNKSVEGRYNYVRRILEMYKNYRDVFDGSDLTWFIKDALVGEVHFSKKAMEYWGKNFPSKISDTQLCVLDEIQEAGSYRILCNLGILRPEGLSIYRINSKVKGLIFEHVIPNCVYVDRLVELYDNGELDEKQFSWLMSQIHVCFILKEEDDRLKEKKLTEKMPDGWRWGDDPFARYKECDIKVWGQN